MLDELVGEAKRLEDAGAVLLNFTNSGPVVGRRSRAGGVDSGARRLRRRAVARRPDADGDRGDRLRADGLDNPPDTYANVAQIALDAITAYADDVRAARQIAGGIRV